jgi:hypothetical protein
MQEFKTATADSELHEFIDAVSYVAGGVENVEDFKFMTDGVSASSSEFLSYATQMLRATPRELRDC